MEFLHKFELQGFTYHLVLHCEKTYFFFAGMFFEANSFESQIAVENYILSLLN